MDIVERAKKTNLCNSGRNSEKLEDCVCSLVIDMTNEIARLREALDKATRFSRYVLQESSFEGCELDGGDAQDTAEKIGLIVPYLATEENRDLWERYEGCEMGCTFFEFVDWMREDRSTLQQKDNE